MNATSLHESRCSGTPEERRCFGDRSFAAVRLALALAAFTSLTGCFGLLKPAKTMPRQFVLTPLPASTATDAHHTSIPVGVGQVKLPTYLLNTSLAIRKGTNEIDYLPLTLWAERLDGGLQRALAANLAALLPTDQVRLSAWRSDDVAVEVYVAIERFDVDASGLGTLVAWWRVLTPGGEKTLKAGDTRLMLPGPAPTVDPAGTVATLSELAGEFSRRLAQVIKETTPANGNTAAGK